MPRPAAIVPQPAARREIARFISWSGRRAFFVGTVALLTIVLIDRWLEAGARILPQTAVADESAHLLTAILILAAIPAALPVRFAGAAVIGAVAIDLDHLPLIMGSDVLTQTTHRPLSHSLVSIGIALAVAAIVPAHWRWAALGLAAGFAAHFWRDLATSTAGVPLLWPLQTTGFRLPYELYIGSLICCVVLITTCGFHVPTKRQS